MTSLRVRRKKNLRPSIAPISSNPSAPANSTANHSTMAKTCSWTSRSSKTTSTKPMTSTIRINPFSNNDPI